MVLEGKFEKIKENVWKMEKEGSYFSVKGYHSISTAKKVRFIHNALESVSFPHIVPIEIEDDPLMIVQPWLDGAKAVNFKKRIDRIDSLAALHALHKTTAQIDWHASVFLHPYPILEKWKDRIARFKGIKKACSAYLEESQIDEILYYAENALSHIKKVYRNVLDGTLLHGDVVHHNILRDPNGMIRFIDFDLACTGPPGTELALWIHRVLPQIGYDVNFLFDEQPSLQKLDEASLSLLLFPNEVIREWLHLFTLSPQSRERQAKQLTLFTDSALSHWPKLWYDVERIKN
ncbi:hypothetical protein AU377_01810 [Sporosarcina sp. HYO08]|nr:hypothetical protein AU377_01810 [Sporosarcina sp. HYO08]